MKKRYEDLISKLEPYCIATPETQKVMEESCLDHKVAIKNILNPLMVSSRSFVEKIFKMDKLAFGDQGMAMDRWVFFDCAVMPGFCFGFAINSNKLSEKDCKALGIGKNELFPLSMYIAIPMSRDNKWFGHNLSSLNGKLEEDLSGLGLLTKTCALDLFKVKYLVGATQWNSLALLIHSKFGPMKLLSARTLIHTKNNTLCYESQISNAKNVLDEKQSLFSEGTLFIPSTDNLISLQDDIEKGIEKNIVRVYLDANNLIFEI